MKDGGWLLSRRVGLSNNQQIAARQFPQHAYSGLTVVDRLEIESF
jgi:hypothetical protein